MTKLLINYSGNWADEVDVKGFKVSDKEAWEKFVESIPDNIKFTEYVGSNQELEYNSKKDWLSDIKVTEISDAEYEVLKKLFPYGFGKFVEPDYWEEEDDE